VKQGRTRLIVAQSLITAILLGVIAVTILSPSDQNRLFGVGVPGPNGPIAQSPPSYEPSEGGTGGGAVGGPGGTSAGTGAAAAGANPAPGTAGTVAGGTTPAAPPGVPSEGGHDGAPGPPGEQYDDTLARLSATVN
jgi:hypothetical protein